jgi:hypothetical protein
MLVTASNYQNYDEWRKHWRKEVNTKYQGTEGIDARTS